MQNSKISRQDPLINVKIIRQKYDDNQYFIMSNIFPKYLLSTRGEIVTYSREIWKGNTLKCLSLMTSVVKYMNILNHLI